MRLYVLRLCAGLLLCCLMPPAAAAQRPSSAAPQAVLAGQAIANHVMAAEVLARGTPPPAEGAWVTLIWQSPEAGSAATVPDLFNGREAHQLTLPGAWSWSDSARFVPPGGLAVTTFNSNGPPFAAGHHVEAGWSRTGAASRFRLEERAAVLAKVAFLGDRMVVHAENRGSADLRMTGVRVWFSTGRNVFGEQRLFENARWFRHDGILRAGAAGGGLIETGPLPRKRVLVELCFRDAPSAWGLLKVKEDRKSVV